MVADVIAELRRVAGNLERYPFKSLTMAEAALLAADALRNVARDFEREQPEPTEWR